MGRPEQETVINAGAPVSFSEVINVWDGVTVTVAVPDWPAVSVIAPEVDGETLETETAKSVVHCALIDTEANVEPEVA